MLYKIPQNYKNFVFSSKNKVMMNSKRNTQTKLNTHRADQAKTR
jgi:hypothetical protein